MKKIDLKIIDTLRYIRDEYFTSDISLAKKLGISRSTLLRWINEEIQIPLSKYEIIYDLVYSLEQDYNKMISYYLTNKHSNNEKIVLFHGSKNGIIGNLSISYSAINNDFGKGFYLGENLDQSSIFVSDLENSKIYSFVFNKKDLKYIKFNVDTDWMLTIAYFRNKLNTYKNSKKIKELVNNIKNIDYIIAPIADNRMFMILDRFINGEITDEQCAHCLSKVNIGNQYVLVSEKALKRVSAYYEFYFCNKERNDIKNIKLDFDQKRNELVSEMLRKYAGKGNYITELLEK